MTDWQSLGQPHIWMPYTQHQLMPEPIAIADAEGCIITLADGRKLIDGTASWWTACHGYKHPALVEAIQKQAAALPHFMFAGAQHEPAMRLAAKLAQMTGLPRVFYSDSGSVAVEAAMKMAVQYWSGLGKRGKQRFITFHHAYHGDTMGAMSLCDPERGMHKSFDGYMPRSASLPIPSDEYGFSEFEAVISGLQSSFAGVVIEPLMQGAGGMKFHSPDTLAELYRITKKYELLFIADEIATGFGRTGYLFACQEAGITPDILCLGKALTGGVITLAATLASEDIFTSFLSDDRSRAFMHGPTYMANPLACAAALVSAELFEREPRLEQISAIEQQLRSELEPCRALPGVVDVRVKGAVGAVQLDTTVHSVYNLRQQALEMGLWLRPFDDVLALTPPFVISSGELTQLTQGIRQLLVSETI